MDAETIAIVDCGRGPQLSTSRITVLDVFYYLHRGHDFEVVHQAMPNLSREEFDVVLTYVKDHRDELAEKDRKAEEFVSKRIEAQRQRGGIFAAAPENLSTEQRVAGLREKVQQRMAEKNGERHSG